jgi:hypothetical protein
LRRETAPAQKELKGIESREIRNRSEESEIKEKRQF